LNIINNQWYTPFNNTHIPDNVINGETALYDIREFNEEEIEDHKIVNEGGYHCYAKDTDAIMDASTCYNSYAFKCIIPAGTLYYEGDFFGSGAYVAKQIKFIKMISNGKKR